MKILITGSQGFVGHHLYRYLKEKGHEVIGMDIRDNGFDQNFKKIDLRKEFEIEGGVDCVFHLASDVGGSKYILNKQFDLIQNNTQMDLRVISECERVGIRKMVYFSSSCVYDNDTAYGYEKAFAEVLVKYSNLDYLIVRPQNFYGIEDTKAGDKEQVIMAFFRKILNPTMRKVEIWGDGEVERSFVHVRDAFDKIMYNLQEKNKTLDLGGEWISINELAKKIMEITKIKKEIVHVEIKGTSRKNKIDFEKNKTSFEEGLKEIYSWINKVNYFNL